jgi:hypothetical protein
MEQYYNESQRNTEHAQSALQQIRDITASLGYNLQKAWKSDRFSYALIESGGKPYFLKLAAPATSPQLTRQLSNEQALVDYGKNHAPLSFRPPRLIHQGSIAASSGDQAYAVFEYIDHHLSLVVDDQLAEERLQSLLPRIVQANLEMIEISDISLEKDHPQIELYEVNPQEFVQQKVQRYIGNARDKWLKDVLESGFIDQRVWQLSRNAQELENFYVNIELGFNNGDFTPRHVYTQEDSDVLIVIDWEHPSMLSPKYYDVAYFFHRTWTDLKSPQLAMEYLNTFTTQLSPEKLLDFRTKFHTILASRIIGGVWDAVRDKRQDVTFHESLQKAWLGKEF